MRGSPIDSTLCLTAVLLLIRPPGPFYVRFAVVALATFVLVWPAARRHWTTWAAITGAVVLGIAAQFPLPDNHIYLLAYWSLAVSLALSGADPAATLAASARWLVGSAFAAAVVWKALLAPDYLDGRFFAVTLLIDDRFSDVVRLAGGLSEADLIARRGALAPAFDGASVSDAPGLFHPAAFARMAMALTWGGVLLEAAVAAATLSGRWRRVSLALLLVFCASTYALAPVTGFGCLLLTMGLAQCRDDETSLQAAFVAVFVLVLFYAEVPWAGLLLP